MEILEVKMIISEIKNSLKRFKSRTEMAEESVNFKTLKKYNLKDREKNN